MAGAGGAEEEKNEEEEDEYDSDYDDEFSKLNLKKTESKTVQFDLENET